MEKKQARFILYKASAAYPNQIELEDETIAVWEERLADVPFEWGVSNLDYHIDRSPYFPKIADIARYDLKPVQNNAVLRLEAAEQFAYLEHWSSADSDPPEGYWEEIKAKLRGGDGG
ncbi:hypothetical protein AB4Z21_00885 [Paenibacillus sp. MCAF20]